MPTPHPVLERSMQAGKWIRNKLWRHSQDKMGTTTP